MVEVRCLYHFICGEPSLCVNEKIIELNNGKCNNYNWSIKVSIERKFGLESAEEAAIDKDK